MKKKKPSARRKRSPEPERWYELVEYFDPNGIRRIPLKEGRAFLMGVIGKVTIVEVATDFPSDQMAKLAKWLEVNGVEALVMTAGPRFVKLRAVPDALAEKLNTAPIEIGAVTGASAGTLGLDAFGNLRRGQDDNGEGQWKSE
jgi:hypothetical protein